MKKYLSRKFLLTLAIIGLGCLIPLCYKHNGISESVTMTVLGLLVGIATAYHVVNIKGPKE